MKAKQEHKPISRMEMNQRLENCTKTSFLCSTAQEETKDALTMNDIRKTRSRHISQEDSVIKGVTDRENDDDNEDLGLFTNDVIPIDSKVEDYSELMTKLSVWDKANIEQIQVTKSTTIKDHLKLLSKLENGTRSSLKNNLSPLKQTDSPQSNRTSQKKNTLKLNSRNNFNFNVFKQRILHHSMIEEKGTGFTPSIANSFNQQQQSIVNDSVIQPEQDHQLMKERERERVEKYNRDDLIKSSKMISLLFISKGKYQTIIEDTYKLLNEMKQEYYTLLDTFKDQKKQIVQQYSSQNKSQINDYPNRGKEDDLLLKALRKKKSFAVKEEMIRCYQSYNEKIRAVEEKERQCEHQYKAIKSDLAKIIANNREEIAKLNHRYREYSKRYEALKKDQTLYYSNLLKQGIDTRTEGLSWILRRLLELNTDIATLQFPSFLNKKQIAYLIQVSRKGYELYQLNIILKELKSRQNQVTCENKKKLLETIDSYATKREETNKEYNSNKGMMKSSSAKLLNPSDRTMLELIEKRKKVFNNHCGNKEEEENKIKRITRSIRNSLMQSSSVDKFLYLENINQMKVVYDNDKTKEYVNNMNILRGRINELNSVIDSVIREQQLIFKAKYRNYSSNRKEESIIAYFELVKNALFGLKHVL